MGSSDSKCEFVATDGTACNNKRLGGGYGTCFAHKCRQCHKTVIDTGNLYCMEHTCRFPKCDAYCKGMYGSEWHDLCIEHE